MTDVNRYRIGEIDMTYNNIPIELYQKLKREIPKEVHVNPFLGTYYYEINNPKAPFTDERVRESLKLGLDRDIITNKVKNQGDLPAYRFTPPYTDGAKLTPPEWFGWAQEKRNEVAKKLLAAASICNKNLSVNLKRVNPEWKTFLDTRHQVTYDVARAGWCADSNEPSSFLNMVLSISSNTPHDKSAEFGKLMARVLKAKTKQERAYLYQKAEVKLDEDSAIVPVYYAVHARLVKPHVGGYTGKDPLDNVYDENLYIIKH